MIGAGPIGLELGQALSRLGSRVTLIDVAPRLLTQADPPMGEALAELLAAEGIELVLDARIERVASRPDGGPRVTVTWDGATRDLDGDAILLGAGRGPDVEALSLPSAGIEAERKGIPVRRSLETSQGGHFAAGDVLGPPYGAVHPHGPAARPRRRRATPSASTPTPRTRTSGPGPSSPIRSSRWWA